MGTRARGSWLPVLSDGTFLGARPADLHGRFVDVYQTFADSWRVTDQSSLFDYAPGTSTKTYTNPDWPPEQPSCMIPGEPTAEPAPPELAKQLCSDLQDRHAVRDCIFDVTVTGEPGFAKAYHIAQQVKAGSTLVTVSVDRARIRPDDTVVFTATVSPALNRGGKVPGGAVVFTLDNARVGVTVQLDANGQAHCA